jgi:hypothetical protein
MKKAPRLIGLLIFAAGVGLTTVGSASNGFQSCGTGGGRENAAPGPPCPHSTVLLTILGAIVTVSGILIAVSANAVMNRRAQRRDTDSAESSFEA